ncbi:hypothetical protein BYT27DRAFT_7194812 [Phlegmacium glaucopus]|nr:hypothetical protein BYT27DRAFT_7194812 [Phlegmacium glaucopus]
MMARYIYARVLTFTFASAAQCPVTWCVKPQDECAPSAGARSLAILFDQSLWTPGKAKYSTCGKDAKQGPCLWDRTLVSEERDTTI